MRATRWLGVALALTLLGVATPTWAQNIEDGTITVIQPKPVLRHHRVQLTPRFATTVNEPLYRQYSVGGTLSYNISERVAIGGTFAHFDLGANLGGTTDRYEQVIRETATIPELAPLTWYGGLDVTFVPLYGKLQVFNRAILFWDLYTTLGAGVVESSTSPHPAGTVAFGANVYFTRWLGMNTEFRDIISSEELPSGNALIHTATTSIGLTLFIPFNFRYADERGGR